VLIAGGISATGFAPLNWWPLTLAMPRIADALGAKA
jgi:hypothetical protein